MKHKRFIFQSFSPLFLSSPEKNLVLQCVSSHNNRYHTTTNGKFQSIFKKIRQKTHNAKNPKLNEKFPCRYVEEKACYINSFPLNATKFSAIFKAITSLGF